MKEFLKLTTLLLVMALVFVGCQRNDAQTQGVSTASPTVAADAGEFAAIFGTQWVLTQVTGPQAIVLDRAVLEAGGFLEAFIISFDENLLFASGAPNTFRAPYTLAGSSLSVAPGMTTMMAPLFEPDVLKEHEFFALLQNVHNWKSSEGFLELGTIDTDGNSIVMVFAAE